MNKRYFWLLAISSITLTAASDDKIFDAFFMAHSHGPADEQIFFARGTPDAWFNEYHAQRPLWSGVGFGVQNQFVPEKKICWLKPNLTLGPAIPDPRGSFIISVETPVVGQYIKKRTMLQDSDSRRLHTADSSRLLANLRSINASFTARGFFGPKSGFLKNFELVTQLAARIPWLDYIPQNFKLVNNEKQSEQRISLRSQNAFLFGINWHIIPPFMRLGVFYEAFSPRFYEEHFKNAVGKGLSFIKNTTISGIKLAARTSGLASQAAAVLPETTDSSAATPVKVKETGLACLGAFIEMLLLNEQLAVGIRHKNVLPDVAADFKTYLDNPGMKELCVYLKTSAFNNWSDRIDFPEISANVAFLQDTKTGHTLNSYGCSFKYRF